MKSAIGTFVSSKEPFRLCFLIGLGIAAAGLFPWPLVQLGWIRGWPGPLHAMAMTQGFLVAFAVGFLGTMLPRRTGAPPLSTPELVLLSVALLSVPLCLGLGVERAAQLAYCLVLLTLGRYALRSLRRTEQKQPPLPSFIWIPAGLFQGFLGALLLFTLPPSSAPPWTYGLARQLAQQGLILSLVLGLAPMLAPMLWTGNAPPPPRHATAQRAQQAGGAVALVASFVLEQSGSISAGLLLRGILCAALLWRVTLPWQPRRRAGLHRVLFRVALWLIPVGFLCAAATPLHRVACLHITFVAGLMALTFATSVHVTLLHSGHEAEAERSSPAVATTVLLLYLAAALRVGADWLGIYFLDGLTAAAGLALLGLLLWAVFLLLKLRRP